MGGSALGVAWLFLVVVVLILFLLMVAGSSSASLRCRAGGRAIVSWLSRGFLLGGGGSA